MLVNLELRNILWCGVEEQPPPLTLQGIQQCIVSVTVLQLLTALPTAHMAGTLLHNETGVVLAESSTSRPFDTFEWIANGEVGATALFSY